MNRPEAPQARCERTGDAVVTLEDPVEILLPRPAQPKDASGESVDGVESTRYADEIRKAMRCKPRTVVIGGQPSQKPAEAPQARWERTGDTVVTVEDSVDILLSRPPQPKDASGEGVDGVKSARYADEIRKAMRCEPQTVVIGNRTVVLG